MEVSLLIAYALGLIGIYFIGKVFVLPVKWLWKLVYNGVIGGVMLWLVNLLGANFSFEIGINLLSALTAGFLGIPGVLLLVMLKTIG